MVYSIAMGPLVWCSPVMHTGSTRQTIVKSRWCRQTGESDGSGSSGLVSTAHLRDPALQSPSTASPFLASLAEMAA